MDVEFHSAVPDVQPEVVRRVVRLLKTDRQNGDAAKTWAP